MAAEILVGVVAFGRGSGSRRWGRQYDSGPRWQHLSAVCASDGRVAIGPGRIVFTSRRRLCRIDDAIDFLQCVGVELVYGLVSLVAPSSHYVVGYQELAELKIESPVEALLRDQEHQHLLPDDVVVFGALNIGLRKDAESLQREVAVDDFRRNNRCELGIGAA